MSSYTAPEDRLAETSAPVHELIAARWSPRVLHPSAEISLETLGSLLEAARWASSWGGTQPARFIVGRRGDATFSALADTLVDGNAWARQAGALVLGVTQLRNSRGALTHGEYDLGQAMAQLALQAVAEGLVTHPMAGFDADAAAARFAVPDDFRAVVLVAVGTLDDPSGVDDGLRAKETRPRRRRPLTDIAFAGEWGTPAL